MTANSQKTNLTERKIRDFQPGAGTRFLWDTTLGGFGVRCTPAGTKSYVVWFRAPAGRKSMTTVARVAGCDLKTARRRAADILDSIREGDDDPIVTRREERAAPTVDDLLARFMDDYCPRRVADGNMAPRTMTEYRKQTRRIGAAMGKVKVAAIKRSHVERFADSIAGRVSRNRHLALLSRLFNLAEQWEYRPLNSNPAKRIERSREQPRERILTQTELAALNEALNDDGLHPAAVSAIRVAAMTGLRISEVTSMRWQDIDFDGGRVELPSTKTGARSHDLPEAALSVIGRQSRNSDFVFSVMRAAPVSYKVARATFTAAAKSAGLDDVRLHDLRRTALTTAAMAGMTPFMVRELAGHKTLQMANRYVQLAGSSPVKAAREQLGAILAGQMAGDTADVVPIDKRA